MECEGSFADTSTFLADEADEDDVNVADLSHISLVADSDDWIAEKAKDEREGDERFLIVGEQEEEIEGEGVGEVEGNDIDSHEQDSLDGIVEKGEEDEEDDDEYDHLSSREPSVESHTPRSSSKYSSQARPQPQLHSRYEPSTQYESHTQYEPAQNEYPSNTPPREFSERNSSTANDTYGGNTYGGNAYDEPEYATRTNNDRNNTQYEYEPNRNARVPTAQHRRDSDNYNQRESSVHLEYKSNAQNKYDYTTQNDNYESNKYHANKSESARGPDFEYDYPLQPDPYGFNPLHAYSADARCKSDTPDKSGVLGATGVPESDPPVVADELSGLKRLNDILEHKGYARMNLSATDVDKESK